MAAEPTTRDALIAELLGDIGLLHDSVKSLIGSLPSQVQDFEMKLSDLCALQIGLLLAASNELKTSAGVMLLEVNTEAQKAVLNMAQAKNNELNRIVTEIITNAINDANAKVTADNNQKLFFYIIASVSASAVVSALTALIVFNIFFKI